MLTRADLSARRIAATFRRQVDDAAHRLAASAPSVDDVLSDLPRQHAAAAFVHVTAVVGEDGFRGVSKDVGEIEEGDPVASERLPGSLQLLIAGGNDSTVELVVQKAFSFCRGEWLRAGNVLVGL
jgi:hypothetical protein